MNRFAAVTLSASRRRRSADLTDDFRLPISERLEPFPPDALVFFAGRAAFFCLEPCDSLRLLAPQCRASGCYQFGRDVHPRVLSGSLQNKVRRIVVQAVSVRMMDVHPVRNRAVMIAVNFLMQGFDSASSGACIRLKVVPILMAATVWVTAEPDAFVNDDFRFHIRLNGTGKTSVKFFLH